MYVAALPHVRAGVRQPLTAATAEGATINGRDTTHCDRRCLERPLYDAPLPLVANNWPALDDPKTPLVNLEAIGGSTRQAVGHATRRGTLVPGQRSLIERGHWPGARPQSKAPF